MRDRVTDTSMEIENQSLQLFPRLPSSQIVIEVDGRLYHLVAHDRVSIKQFETKLRLEVLS
jgi:hypothetical protein